MNIFYLYLLSVISTLGTLVLNATHRQEATHTSVMDKVMYSGMAVKIVAMNADRRGRRTIGKSRDGSWWSFYVSTAAYHDLLIKMTFNSISVLLFKSTSWILQLMNKVYNCWIKLTLMTWVIHFLDWLSCWLNVANNVRSGSNPAPQHQMWYNTISAGYL